MILLTGALDPLLLICLPCTLAHRRFSSPLTFLSHAVWTTHPDEAGWFAGEIVALNNGRVSAKLDEHDVTQARAGLFVFSLSCPYCVVVVAGSRAFAAVAGVLRR